MGVNLTQNALALEAVKDNDHFLLIYPNTPAGRLEAKQAVRDWVLDLELDFNRRDAEQLWRAIDRSRFNVGLDNGDQRNARWCWRGRATT